MKDIRMYYIIFSRLRVSCPFFSTETVLGINKLPLKSVKISLHFLLYIAILFLKILILVAIYIALMNISENLHLTVLLGALLLQTMRRNSLNKEHQYKDSRIINTIPLVKSPDTWHEGETFPIIMITHRLHCHIAFNHARGPGHLR